LHNKSLGMQPSHCICKPAYLVLVAIQDKLGRLWQEGHPAQKWGDNGGGSLISPDGLVPIHIVAVSASCYLPLHYKLQKKISSGIGSPG